MSIEIRKGIDNDFSAIHSIIKEFATFIGTPDKVSITVEQMKQDKDFFQCLVAVENEKIIGFATYFYSYHSWIGKALYIDDLYVIENHRGKNAGTNLMDALINMARKQNCKKVKWQVSHWNTNAINFYKKLGAVIDDVENNCDLVL